MLGKHKFLENFRGSKNRSCDVISLIHRLAWKVIQGLQCNLYCFTYSWVSHLIVLTLGLDSRRNAKARVHMLSGLLCDLITWTLLYLNIYSIICSCLRNFHSVIAWSFFQQADDAMPGNIKLSSHYNFNYHSAQSSNG